MDQNMKIAIIIPTYQRPDGKTPFYLDRALKSVENQTHKDYRIYVIGDKYENKEELQSIVQPYHVFWGNLSKAIEREKYPFGDYRLYCTGGASAAQIGINLALKAGYQYICCLDHDDWWDVDHLEQINKIIEAKNPFFICTLSTCLGRTLPDFAETHEIKEFLPVPCGMINSSACIKYSDTKLRARDCCEKTGTAYPADADLWRRLSAEMKAAWKQGYVYTGLTCHHEEEGYSLK